MPFQRRLGITTGTTNYFQYITHQVINPVRYPFAFTGVINFGVILLVIKRFPQGLGCI